MIKRTVNLASDLEWMLRSQQVNEGTIVDMLVRDYYPSIYELAFSTMNYPKYAFRTAREVFVRAGLKAKDYPPDSGIEEWPHSIAIKVLNEQQYFIAEQRI